jgi:hypothetical protein
MALAAVTATPFPPAPMLATVAPLPKRLEGYHVEQEWDGFLHRTCQIVLATAFKLIESAQARWRCRKLTTAS